MNISTGGNWLGDKINLLGLLELARDHMEEDNMDSIDQEAEDAGTKLDVRNSRGRPRLSKASFLLTSDDLKSHSTNVVFPKLDDYIRYLEECENSDGLHHKSRKKGTAFIKIAAMDHDVEVLLFMEGVNEDLASNELKMDQERTNMHKENLWNSISHEMTWVFENQNVLESRKNDNVWLTGHRKFLLSMVHFRFNDNLKIKDIAQKLKVSSATISRNLKAFRSNQRKFIEDINKGSSRSQLFSDAARLVIKDASLNNANF